MPQPYIERRLPVNYVKKQKNLRSYHVFLVNFLIKSSTINDKDKENGFKN